MPQSNAPPWFFIGVDWAYRTHQFCLVDATGKVLEQGPLAHEGGAVRAWLAGLLRRAAGNPAALAAAIETPRGILVETLLDSGIAVFAINPKQLDRLRDRHFPSGAKDDRRDAFLLGESLRTDPHFFRRVKNDDPPVRRLRELSRHDGQVTADFVRVLAQFREQLARFYPQLLALVPAADEAWLWALLRLAPTPAQGAQLRLKKIAGILSAHRIRRLAAEEVRGALRATGFALAPGSAEAHSECALLLLDHLELLHRQRQAIEKRLEEILASLTTEERPEDPPIGQQSDAAIILSLPGIGTRVAATLLSEAASALQLRDYRALRILAGAAPITRQSGKSRTVKIRRASNPRLRNALFHWSMVSYQRDPKNQTQYQSLRAQGHSHARSLRGIADRNLKLLCSMLLSRTLYNPALRQTDPHPPPPRLAASPSKREKQLAKG